MTDREQYEPGPATGAQVVKDGETWTLILVRDLSHSPERVWEALTDPAHLREWAPFDVDGESRCSWNGESHLGGNHAAIGNKSDTR